MEGLILYFFLLILTISLDFSLHTGYKWKRFFKILPENVFIFALSRRDKNVGLKLSFWLFLVKVNFTLKKQSRKKDELIAL